MKTWRGLAVFSVLLLSSTHSPAQEYESGVAVPFSITGGAFQTQHLKSVDENAASLNVGFRALFQPSLKLGEHWAAYAAVDVSSLPFYYYNDSYYYSGDRYRARLIQGFLAYTANTAKTSWIFKAGRLTSAFGSFPSRYDDAINPLLDQPLAYGSALKLRSDQLPCGPLDLLEQRGPDTYSEFHCGGAEQDRTGIFPVTLYGIPGAELDVSHGNADARLQVTNSSPANPLGLTSGGQHPQWTAGGGYTIRQGLRFGGSVYRGPYLDPIVDRFLPPGRSFRSYAATGAGLDFRWAWRRVNATAEIQRFQFNYPNLTESPVARYAYAELKCILTPRLYVAGRAEAENHNRVSAEIPFNRNRQSYELTFGYRPNRWQLIKTGYVWRRTEGIAGTRDNVFGIQYVTSVDSISRVFR